MTFFSLARFMSSTFSSSEVSTNGPFFSDRLITSLWADLKVGLYDPLLLRAPLNDEPVRVLPTTCLITLRRLAPRRHRVTAAGRLAFAAAERVIHRVHRHTANVRTLAEPAAAPRLADRDVLVIEVADLTDGRDALDADLANLAR